MKIKTNGIEINCAIEGDGPWLVMSHSLACNLSMWDGQARLLAKKFKVLRFDTRGHGQSDVPSGPYTLEQMADDVHGLFAALGIGQAHWVGLSMGGMIGQTFALKYPGMFRSMVLADTAASLPPGAGQLWSDRIRIALEQGMGPLVEGTLARWFTEPYRRAHPEVMAKIGSDILSTPAAGYAGCCHAISRLDLVGRLHEIDCPALVVVGDQDPGTPPELARQIHAHLRGSQLCIIESAAHLSNIEQPEGFNKALLGFLDRVA
jgi:3-oxoadipate enol-lactonase